MIPDRSHLDTERRHPDSGGLHLLAAAELVRLMQASTAEVMTAMQAAEGDLTALIEAATPGFRRGGRVVYLGAGTSGRLGVLDASEIPPTFGADPGRFVGIIAGGDRCLRLPSEGAEDDPAGAIPALTALALSTEDTVIGIAAGGTTPFVREALAWCAALPTPPGAWLITCAAVEPPPGCRRVLLPTGPELLTGSTRLKAGTATKLALNTISTALMVLSGAVHGNLMIDVRAGNAKLRDRAVRIVMELVGCDRDAAIARLEAADWVVRRAVG